MSVPVDHGPFGICQEPFREKDMIVVHPDGPFTGDDQQRILYSLEPEQLSVPEWIHPVDGLFLLYLQQLFGDPVPFMLDQGFNFGHRCL